MRVEKQVESSKIILVQGDITNMDADVIVNPANKELILGGGVAGAIRRKGGEVIQEECDRIGGTYVGGAVLTSAGNLKARYVIHAVGPQMGEGDEDTKLKNATVNSLLLAEEHKLKRIAFPAISTGIFGYPIEKCAEIMLKVSIEYLKRPTILEEVYFCLWGDETFNQFNDFLQGMIK